MIGDTVIDDGKTYEVVWNGGEGLIPDRLTKPSNIWTPPKRLYNKKSDYWKTHDFKRTNNDMERGDLGEAVDVCGEAGCHHHDVDGDCREAGSPVGEAGRT